MDSLNECSSSSLRNLSSGSKISLSFGIAMLILMRARTDDSSALLMDWIDRANETIHIMVMLITHDELADTLIEAQNRGVDVDIIFDDDWYFSSGSDYQRILDSGVDIRGDARAV